MPSFPKNSSSASVLLIEEYDALAVALESALKKFAPNHRTDVARSLNEARSVALAHKPELIMLDFDPPHPGAIAFFEEMRHALPESRVLVIAAEDTREVIAERGAQGALQFLKKPFELVDLGAAVQALLGPWQETGTSRGTLRDMAAIDAALLGCFAINNMAIGLNDDGKRNGQLFFQNGQLIHALTEDEEGETALAEMLGWKGAHFTEIAKPTAIPHSISTPWRATLTEALRAAKKRYPPAPTEMVPSHPAPTIEKTGPKILVIDDTDMLLIFVEDSLALRDPSLRISTAPTGLEGVKAAERLEPDLVLVDFCLPDIKGDEVCRRIGANEKTARVPIVMMSGHVPEMTAAAGRLRNVVATIAKPFLSEALIELVQKKLKQGPLPQFDIIAPQKKNLGPENAPAPPPETSEPPGAAEKSIETERARNERTREIALEPPAPPLPILGGIMQPQISVPLPEVAAVAPALSPNEVLLDLPLDVISMQFTTTLQLGAIRARVASPTVAIQIPALAARAALPLETGFLLGTIDLGANGGIAIIRLLPTTQPFQPVTTQNAFEIGGVAVVPANERERLQLVTAATSRLTMQLFAPLELESVELAANMEIRQLVLRCRSNAVRVTLNSQTSRAQSVARFETIAVQLDDSSRISELTLAPIG